MENEDTLIPDDGSEYFPPLYSLFSDPDGAENGDAPILYLAPSPTPNTAVSANDLLTFVGSGAHDFLAYRTSTTESYCIYPVRIDSGGRVTGTGCTVIRITTASGTRSISYSTDDINLQLTGTTYNYSDMTGKYVMLWSAEAYRPPMEMIQGYILIALCLASLFGALIRRFKG